MLPREVVTSQDEILKRKRLELCPKGFIPASGFGNARTCATCHRSIEEHAVVVQ